MSGLARTNIISIVLPDTVNNRCCCACRVAMRGLLIFVMSNNCKVVVACRSKVLLVSAILPGSETHKVLFLSDFQTHGQ